MEDRATLRLLRKLPENAVSITNHNALEKRARLWGIGALYDERARVPAG
jgi:hypothetical protein